MYAAVILASLFAFSASVSSTAFPKRDVTITVYTNTNYGGDSSSLTVVNGKCADAGQYNDKISSVKTYGASCKLFEDYGCQGASYSVNGDTPSLEGVFNDKMSSFTCY